MAQKASLPPSFSHYKTLFNGLAAHITGKKLEAILISVPLHVAYFPFLFIPFLFECFVVFSLSLFRKFYSGSISFQCGD